MCELGHFICAIALIVFIILMVAFLAHRYLILNKLITKKLSEFPQDDPDFDYDFYMHTWR